MVIPEHLLKCVMFLGRSEESGPPRLMGTAFLVGRPAGPGRLFGYLVTARHVVHNIRKRASAVLVRFNMKDGEATWAPIPVEDWLEHPTDPSVDVAVAPVAIPEELDHLVVPISLFVDAAKIAEHGIGLGDEVVVTGLFVHHHGRLRNSPVVRVGNIAALPTEPVDSKIGPIEAYLVEARSIGGLSGSPTFVHLGIARFMGGKVRFAENAPVYFLLGLMHGHWDVEVPDADDASEDADAAPSAKRVNMGIAMVVPAHRIAETLAHPAIQAREAEALAHGATEEPPAQA